MDKLSNLNELDASSMDELQRQLITWVEEKGLLNELRAYLRKKMIFLLKDTILDQSTSVISHLCVTPKLQAIALLVAEYLLSQQLYYTLSVFSTEVPTITHVNKFCQQIQNANDKKEKAPKLDTNEITHILEAVGISAHAELSDKIVSAYVNATDRKESLLACIVDCVSASAYNLTGRMIEKLTQASNTEETLGGTRTINTMADLNLLFEDYHLQQYQSAVFLFMEKQYARIKAEEKAKYKSKLYKHQKLLYQEVKTREEFVLNKLNEAETRLFNQKQQIEANLKRKQINLQELADELNIIHTQLTKREELVNEAVTMLKSKSNTNICEQQSNEKNQSQLCTPSDCGISKNSQEQLLTNRSSVTPQRTTDSDQLCERKLFSDIILGLQQENAALRDQTLRHRTSIMKLKTKLARKKSIAVCAVRPPAKPLVVTASHFHQPCSILSPIMSSDNERKSSSRSSIKSDSKTRINLVVEQPKSARSFSSGTQVPREIKSNKEISQSINKGDIIDEHQMQYDCSDHIQSFVHNQPVEGQKSEANYKIETKPISAERPKTTVRSSLSTLEVKLEIDINQTSGHKQEPEMTRKASEIIQPLNMADIDKTFIIKQIELPEQVSQQISNTKQIPDIIHEPEIKQSNEVLPKLDDNKGLEIDLKTDIVQKSNVTNDCQKQSLPVAATSVRPLLVPDLSMELDKIDIPKKIQNVEDCLLHSKRVPNIYYTEPCVAASHKNVQKPCSKCSSTAIKETFIPKSRTLKKDVQCNSHKEQYCYKSRNDIPVIKCCKQNPVVMENESMLSVRTDTSISSINGLPRNRKQKRPASISGVNIEEMDENELFRKVCTSLGVPISPVTTKSNSKYPELYMLKNAKVKQNNPVLYKYCPIFEKEENEINNEKASDLTTTFLDESSLSTCSENSRDCITPASLILESSGSSV